MDYYFLNKLEEYIHHDNLLCLLLKISNNFPKQKIIYFIFLIYKFLPLIVVTHDWNINSKLGISFWIRKFTLAEIFSEVKHIYFYYIIVFCLFIILIIIAYFIFFLKKKITFNGKLFRHYKKQILFCSYNIFYIFYANSQLYFSIFVENIFNEYSKKQNKFLYYLIIILEGIITIFTLIISFLMGSIIIHEPFFINSLSPILNEIGKIDFFSIFIIIMQIIVQLEINLTFKSIFLIKVISRVIFCIYYIQSFINYNNYYYKYYFFYFFKLFQSFCFVSCIIEFIIVYDYDNKLIILQKDNAIIILKLFLEIMCGIFLNEIYFYFDHKKIKEQVRNFSHKNTETFNNKMIKFLNMLYYQQTPIILKSILQELNISIANRVHNPICIEKKGIEKCYFCHIYSSQNFISQMNFFISSIKTKNNLESNCIKTNFPLLFSFFENEINHYKEINFSNKKSISALLFIVNYIYVYERNFYKCLFILEKIQSCNYIQKSFLSKYQISFFKHKLIKFYKKELHSIQGNICQIIVSENKQKHNKKILKYMNNFKCLDRISYTEILYKQFLFDYIKNMNSLNDDTTNYYYFKNIIEQFFHNYKNIIDISYKLFTSFKFNYIYPINKLIMFFQFFRNKIPSTIKKSFDNFFIEQNTSLIENKFNFYALILKICFIKNETSFKISHASDNLIQKLRYSHKDFNSLNFNEIFAKTFYKSYKYIFETHLSEGIDYFKLNNLCLVDKDKYVISFDLIGVPIYQEKGIELYIKLKEAKEQLLINKNKKTKLPRKKTFSDYYKKTKSSFCGSSFLFTNKYGKIYNLSRGFEDYFLLNTNVLERYNINIMELLNIEKLDSKGTIKKNLLKIYDNIYDIYLREVGQLGEDPFSQVILQIKEIKNNISLFKNNFIVDINYEEKNLCKEGRKRKYYYLFVLTINLEETNGTSHSSEIIQMFQQQSSNIFQTEIYTEAQFNSIIKKINYVDKDKHQFYSLKLSKINNLADIIINKFFKIKTQFQLEIFNVKLKKDEMKTDTDKFELLNIQKKEKKEKKKEKKMFMLLKILPSIISIFFIIIYVCLYILKISKIKGIKIYFQGSSNALMLSHASIQMIIKIIEIQIKNNNLQTDKINNSYNNSLEYHISTLNDRVKDYLTYKVQFLEFYHPFMFLNKITNLTFLYPQNYSIPDVNGKKNFVIIDSIMTSLNIFSNIISNFSYLTIIYNNSEYYYNETMINDQGINKYELNYFAKAYILIIDNFAKFYIFYYTELLNSIMTKIHSNINSQYIVSQYTLLISFIYALIIILFFFIFFKQTQKIIKESFHCHITIRFFNHYITRKTLIVLDIFDNYSENYNYKQFLDDLEIIEDNEEEILTNQILSDLIYDYNIIRIKPYSIKSSPNSHKNNVFSTLIKNNDIIENENKRSFIEMSTFSSIKNQNKFLNVPQNNITSKRKSQFIHKTDIEGRSSAEITFAQNPVSITKELMSNHSSNNLTNPSLIQNSLNNTNNAINTGTNNTLNTNSTNVNNNEISLSKSNIPLNSNTNRTFKSSLKLLNENNIKKKHTKRNSFNQVNKEENEKKEVKFIQGGYKLLPKPFLYLNFFIELIIFMILFIIIAVIEIVISKINNNMLKSVIQTRNDIFQQFNFIAEMFIIYLLSIINNEEIIVSYIGSDLSYSCKDSLKHKYNKEKNIYNYLNLCYPSIKEGFDNITLGKIDKKLKHTRKFHLLINTENFCNEYSNFLINNKFDYSIPDLVYLQSLQLDHIYNECENIGNGFNSKGLTTAFESIFQVLTNHYKDFKKDNNRTEISNIERLNNNYITNIQVEIERVLRKVIVCYYIVFNWDYNKIEEIMIRNKFLIYIVIFLIIILTISVYSYNMHIFSEELKTIQFFNDCIINTILFL